jgi:hypothetical protein
MSLMGVIAWVTGNVFVFPSLGPTAYMLAFDRVASTSARVVIGGHACGVLGGLAGYRLFGDPYHLLMFAEPLSGAGAGLALGAVCSIALTAMLMLSLRVSHPPACATTLIISLGILPRLADAAVILLGVAILYGGYRTYHALLPAQDR